MKRLIKNVRNIALLLALVWCGGILADKSHLHRDVLRLHIVAHNNSYIREQGVLVQKAVVNYLHENACFNRDIMSDTGKLQSHLVEITNLADQTLKSVGATENVAVKLCKEPFETCIYDTFILPSGVYDSLQITIGDGQAGDLRSTVFPVSCDSATAKEFYDNALASGMTESLINTLITGGSGKIRLLVLDYLGRLENILFHL